MNHQLLGALLKGERIRQKKSQKELCYGICVPSYLCKIENGSANPDEQMWKKLFRKLDLPFEWEQPAIHLFQKKIEEYFHGIKFHCDRDALYTELNAWNEQLRFSELVVDWLMIRIDQDENEWDLLEELVPVMTLKQQALFTIMKYSKEKLSDSEIAHYIQMCELLDESFALNLLSLKHLHRGEYAAIHRLEGKIVAKALCEGNLYQLADYYIINGSAYACINQLEMMMDYYKRAIGLLEHTEWKENLTSVYYNMGASYVSVGEYEKGIDYLRVAQETYHMEDFMLQHKLALAYVRLQDYEKAQTYLSKMKNQLSELPYLRKADHLKYQEVCMEMEEGFQQKPEYLTLMEELVEAVERDYHVGHLVFYNDLAMETYCLHRKYKKALELDRKISSIILENIH